MSATIEVDRALRVTTIVTSQTLNAADRIAIMDKIGVPMEEFESTNILLDVRKLDQHELPGVKNLVVQLGLRRFKMFALVGGAPHEATLRRIVQWFPFGNTLNVFSTLQDAQQWLALQLGSIRRDR
jgi:hypothetical protein